MKKSGLYVHFPFCRRACFYCHFLKKKYRPELTDAYLHCLTGEMRRRRDAGLRLDTVYIGGGSPSLLTAAQLEALLAAAAENFVLGKNAEVTLEANPEDLAVPRLRAFRRAGVNRLSIGVQSFQDRDLRFLRRTHSAERAMEALQQARDAGFMNISLDLIIGLETQTFASMAMNLRRIEQFRPAHVSVYILEGVPRPAADERDARLYFQVRQGLVDMGYDHYEVSNFCRPGRAARHNLKYWRDEPYIGIGASAAGYLHGRDYRNLSDLKKYCAVLEEGLLPERKTAPLQPARRRIVTGLRLLAGIPASAFTPFAAAADFLLAEGFLIRRGRNIAVAPQKILLLNEILGYFI